MARAALTYPEPFPAARLCRLDGARELAIAAAAARPGSRPERLTRVLAAAYARVGEGAASLALVRRLASGAREWLAQRLALVLRPDLEWFEAPCAACGESYDVAMALAEAPVKPAGEGFPVVEIATSLGPRSFEAPCGWHEEQAARRPGRDLRRRYAALTGLSDAAAAEAARFTAADLDAIETALDALSPDVADSVAAACPACGAETRARVEPLRATLPRSGEVLGEVHLLATAYHWSEREILSLSPDRRRGYAGLIRRDRQGAGR